MIMYAMFQMNISHSIEVTMYIYFINFNFPTRINVCWKQGFKLMPLLKAALWSRGTREFEPYKVPCGSVLTQNIFLKDNMPLIAFRGWFHLEWVSRAFKATELQILSNFLYLWKTMLCHSRNIRRWKNVSKPFLKVEKKLIP